MESENQTAGPSSSSLSHVKPVSPSVVEGHATNDRSTTSSDSRASAPSAFEQTGFEAPLAAPLAPVYDRIASPSEVQQIESQAARLEHVNRERDLAQADLPNEAEHLPLEEEEIVSPTLSEASDIDVEPNEEAAAVENKVADDLINHPAVQSTAEQLKPLLLNFGGVHNFRDLSSYPTKIPGKVVCILASLKLATRAVP